MFFIRFEDIRTELMLLNLADDMANDAPPIVETFTPFIMPLFFFSIAL